MSCIQSVSYTRGAFSAPVHSHDTDHLILVCSGLVDVTISGRKYTINQPSVIFISHLEEHIIYGMDSLYTRYVINFDFTSAYRSISDNTRLLSPYLNLHSVSSHVLQVSSIIEPLTAFFKALLDEVNANDFPDGQNALLQCIFQLLFRHAPDFFSNSTANRSAYVRDIQLRLHRNPAEDISFSALAEEYYISYSYLSHRFKSETGYSLGRYRYLCRLSLAKNLLVSTEYSISEIASRCGFPDVSNFGRSFLKDEGCTPTSFRRKNASKHLL